MKNPRCVICDEEIKNPKIGILYCDNKKCRDEYDKNMQELFEFNMQNKSCVEDTLEKHLEKLEQSIKTLPKPRCMAKID